MDNAAVGNATPVVRIAEDFPAEAPYIEREFKRLFPTLELLNFNAGHHHWVSLAGTETELLRLKILDPSMIAVRPKRLASMHRGPGTPGTCIWTRRGARDRVEAHIELDESLDRAHPFAPFAIWNWRSFVRQCAPPEPVKTSAERLEFCESLLNMILQCARGEHPSWPDALPLDAQARIEGRIDTIFAELQRYVPTAPPRPSHLRLVVDNEVRS
jgi:hypothetical protein